jgi:MFS family permease
MNLLKRIALDVTPLRRHRDFRLLFIAMTVTSFGSYITYVTIPYQVTKLTGDPLLVGLIGVCELVPLVVMGFIGGALADYVDRRILVFGGEVLQLLLTGLLMVNTLFGSPKLWLLYLVAGLGAAVDGLQRPALEGLIPRLVPPDEIPATSALSSLRHQFAGLLAPSIAGLLIAAFGAGRGLSWVYAIDLATFLVSLAFLSFMKSVPPPERADRPSLSSVATGIRYAVSRPELLGTYVVDINAMAFGMPMALFPFFADRLGGPAVLGLLYSGITIGSILATLTSGWAKRVNRHGLAVILAAGTWGLGIILFGLAHSLWLAMLGLIVAGFADMVSGIFRSTIWNQTIPDHLRGRLAGIEMLSYSVGPLAGGVRSGGMARMVGVSGSVIWGGVLCVAGTVALALALPKFRRYDGRQGLARNEAEEAERAALVASSA